MGRRMRKPSPPPPAHMRRRCTACCGRSRATGLFRSDSDGRFSLTPLGAVLRSDARGAARSTVLALSGTFFWAAWGEVLHSLRTGETGIQKALGVSEYEYLD